MLIPFVLSTLTLLADPKAPETLPAPRAVEQPVVITSFYRRSHYDVWYLTAPNFQGVWQPRIDHVPGQGYYVMYNGAPFFYAPNHQTWYRGNISGTPYRSFGPTLYIVPEVVEVKPAKPAE